MSAEPNRPDLAWANAGERKRKKRLKRAVARAARVRREGLHPRDVPCPHCGAPPFVSVKRDPGYCRTYAGGHHDPLRGHADHKARVQEAARLKAEILRDGEEAAEKLSLLRPRDIPETPRASAAPRREEASSEPAPFSGKSAG